MRPPSCAILATAASLAGAASGASRPDDFWIDPFERAALLFSAADEYDRPYSVPARPRDLAGFIAISCEYQEGRPCGDGIGTAFELDSEAGWGNHLTAASRVRASAGTDRYVTQLILDRVYLRFEAGPLLLQVGRDVLTLGPAVRAGLMVSRNAAPQDGIRVKLKPVALPFVPDIRFSLLYFLDRLRDPQRFHGTLLDCARLQLDFWDRVQLGGSRLLQIGGDGAPYYGGFEGFILEHFGRTREGVAQGTAENNRLSFDLSVRIPELRGARLYYEIAFEDTRKAFWNSLRYDADHLVGIELAELKLGAWRRLFIELEHTGWVSQEHSVFSTGMTNAGHTLGSALGPDGTSLWLRADFEAGRVVLSPWVEWLRFVGDQYDSDQARGVFVTVVGPIEHRQRLGADAQVALTQSLSLSGGVFGERIGNADLVNGFTRYSGGLRAALVWTP
jgi:hypothetical protein